MSKILNGQAREVSPPQIHLPRDLVELTARKFCKRIGVNPDDKVQVPHPAIAGTFKSIQQWEYFAPQMANFMVEMEVIFAAQAEYEQMQQDKFVRKLRSDFVETLDFSPNQERNGEFSDPEVEQRFSEWVEAKMQAEKQRAAGETAPKIVVAS